MLLWSSPLGQWPSSAVLHSGRKGRGRTHRMYLWCGECFLSGLESWGISQEGEASSTDPSAYSCLTPPGFEDPLCDWERRKCENEFPLCPQANLCLIRSFEGKLITWLCARPQQIHNIFVVPQLSHHFEFRHESFSFRAVCFLCQWKNINVKQEF